MVSNSATLPIHNSNKSTSSPTPCFHFRLDNFLHVPNISLELLSIYNITKENNYCLIFDQTGFLFQEIVTNKTLHDEPS